MACIAGSGLILGYTLSTSNVKRCTFFVFQCAILVYVLQFLDESPCIEDEFLLAKFATDCCVVRACPFSILYKLGSVDLRGLGGTFFASIPCSVSMCILNSGCAYCEYKYTISKVGG